MPGFKVRRQARLLGGAQIGTSGSMLDQMIIHQTTACVPAITASGDYDSGSISVPGVAAGDMVFVMPVNAPEGLMVYSACATAANQVTASYAAATGVAVGASTITFNILVLSAS